MNSLTLALIKYKYVTLFGLSALEGPIVACAAGFLVSRGYLSLFLVYPIIVLGDIIPDSIYYFIGRFGAKKHVFEKIEKKFHIGAARIRAIEHLWHKDGFKAMFISKMAYGLSTPFLMIGGLVKIPVKKFYLYTTTVTLIKCAAFLFIGYLLGDSYTNASGYITGITIGVAIGVLGYGYYMLSKNMGKKFENNGKEL